MSQDRILSPLIVNFAVTRECNQRCKHCYSNANDSTHPNELNTTAAKRVITEIAQAGTRLLIFDGGEPLMRDDIYDLIAHANDSGLQPMLGTNATLLGTEAAERMKKAGIKAVAVSLHGSDAKSHDDFCVRQGSWERAMAGICNVTGAGIPLQINTCIHHNNIGQVDSIIDLAKSLKAEAIEIFQYMPIGRGKENHNLVLTTEDQRYLIDRIIHHQLNEDNDIFYRCIALPQFWVEVEKTAINKIIDKEVLKRFTRACCGTALRYCCIFYEGTVYPCMLLQKGAGNIRERSFQEIWQGAEVFNELRVRDKLGGKCGKCDYRQVCGGARCIVFEKTGSLTKEDHRCWYKKKELKRVIAVQEAGCNYCGKETTALCQVCQSPICESHSLYCPICQSLVCHPDANDCFFKHSCK